MTNLIIKSKVKLRKGLLYLMAIAVMVAIMSIACNKKPTQASNFVAVDNTPWTDGEEQGGVKYQSKTLDNTDNADSPVVIVSGEKVILAYGKNDKIYYRSSHDGGNTLTTELVFGENDDSGIGTKKYPHIFFKNDNIIAVATITGKVDSVSKPLGVITGAFKMSDNGVGYIEFGKWKTPGIINENTMSGDSGSALKTERYFNKVTDIQTAAGVGRIVSGKYLLPLSESKGDSYVVLEAKQYQNHAFGFVWDLKEKKNKTATQIVKLDLDGTAILNSDVAEKAGSYSIKSDGTITGITENPTVGEGTTAASIAEDGEGTIYTFTKEKGGLVFRKFDTNIK